MLDANRYPTRHRLQANNSQNKKLFSDLTTGTFRCDKGRTLKCCSEGLEGSFTGHKSNLGRTQLISIPFTLTWSRGH